MVGSPIIGPGEVKKLPEGSAVLIYEIENVRVEYPFSVEIVYRYGTRKQFMGLRGAHGDKSLPSMNARYLLLYNNEWRKET